MSAAPVITAAFDGGEGFGLRVAKKPRVRSGSSTRLLEDGEGVSCAESIPRPGRTSEFESHVADLREQFSSVSEALVSSILECTGDKPEQARCLLSQILAANPNRADDRKRRRSSGGDEEEDLVDTSTRTNVHPPIHNHPPIGLAATAPASPTTCHAQDMISQWLDSVLRRLHNAQSQADVVARLRPAVEELLWQHQENVRSEHEAAANVRHMSQQKMAKILSRAILSQTDKIANLELTVNSRTSEVELLQQQVCHMQRRMHEVEELNQKLRRDNGWLHHYIRCQHSSSSQPNFDHRFHGPDVY